MFKLWAFIGIMFQVYSPIFQLKLATIKVQLLFKHKIGTNFSRNSTSQPPEQQTLPHIRNEKVGVSLIPVLWPSARQCSLDKLVLSFCFGWSEFIS